MGKNINSIKISVYKDAEGMLFPTGKTTIIPCDHELIVREGLSVMATVTPCLETRPEGEEIIGGSTVLPALIDVYKLKVNGAFIWVSVSDYDANIGKCNGCCVAVSCEPPTTIVAGSITTTGATITFTPPTPTPAGFEYIVNESATTPVIAGTYDAGSPIVLTGLTTGTLYHFWIRTRCGATSASSWVNITFTTS